MGLLNFCLTRERAAKWLLGTGFAAVLAVTSGDQLFAQTSDSADNRANGQKKVESAARSQKPGRERDLSAQRAAEKKANSAAKIDVERFSAGAVKTPEISNVSENPCATGPKAKVKVTRRLVKSRSREAGEQQRANAAALARDTKVVDCPDEPAVDNAKSDNVGGAPDGKKNAPIAKAPIARRLIKGAVDAGKPDEAPIKSSGKAADICGDPNRIAVLTPQEAQAHRNKLNSVLRKSGFTNAGQGQRVPLRWYFNLPFRTTVADMVGKRAAPVNDTAVLTKIMGFSTDCNVITAFSKDTRNAQPVTADYDVKVEFKKTDSDQFQSLGSFFKGAPASVFTRPGIFRLTATARGKLSPFKIGPVTHVVRVDSAGLKRAFGITQLLIKNPGKIPGTAFSIGSKRTAETDAKRHCKSYRFTAFARSGKIISESSTTIQTSQPSNKQYNNASFDLFQDGRLLDQQGPGPFYDFDAKKFGDGNYVLKAKIAREDQGPGPKNFQVPETQHVITVFRCGVINAPQIAAKGGKGKKGEKKPDDKVGPPEERGGGDIPGVIIHELEEGKVIIHELEPDRFLKKAKAPSVAGPFLGSCEACKREIRRRHNVEKRSCSALVGSMQQLILNVPAYNQLEIDYENAFKAKILAPLAVFRQPQTDFQSKMRAFVEKAANANVLQSKSAQALHRRALAKVAERDRKRLAKNPANQLSIPLIIQDDLPGPLGEEVFALVPPLVSRVNKFRSEFVKLNTDFNKASRKSGKLAAEFVGKKLPEALEELQKLLDEMAEMRKEHLKIQAEIASTFASKSHEHCLGTPRGSQSVVAPADGSVNFTEVDGIPGMNVTLVEHPDNRPTPEDFLAAAKVDPPKDLEFEGLEDFVPLKFKFDGVAYRNFENDFKRRFRELNGFFFTRAAAIGGTIQTIKKVSKIVAGAVADFAVAQAKTAFNVSTFGLAFEDETNKNIDNLVKFFGKTLPRGFDIVVGTDLAALINEENRVKQSDKFNGVKVLQNIAGLGVGQLAEAVGKGTVENVIAAAEARDLAINGELSGNFAEEIAQQDKINKGFGAGIVVAVDLFGGKAFEVGAKFIKFGGKTFKTVDKAVDAANARRIALKKPPLTAKQIAKFKEAQSYAVKANELIAKVRKGQKARLLARAAERAKKLDELVDLSKNNNLTDDLLEVVIGKGDDVVPPVNKLDDVAPPVKGVDDVAPPVKGVDDVVPPKKVVEGEAPPKKVVEGEAPPKKVVEGEAPPKKVVEGDAPPKKVVEGEVPPKQVVQAETPPKPIKRRVKEPNRNPKQPRRGSKEAKARDAEELAKKNADQQPPKNGVDGDRPLEKTADGDAPVANKDVDELFAELNKKPDRPDVSGDDFFKELDNGPNAPNAVDELFNKPPLNVVDEAAEQALKQKKARKKLKQALIRRNNARNAKQIKPAKVGKVDEKIVKLPDGKSDIINNPKKSDTFGSGKTTTAVKLDPKNPDTDVLKAFDKKSAADSKLIVDDQIAGAKKLKQADVNFLDIKGRGKVDIDTQIADGTGKLKGPKVKRTNEFLIQEQLPKDAIELEVLIEGRKAAGIKPLLTEAEQIEILRQFNKTSDAGLVVRDTNFGNIAAKADGEALFIESGSVIDAPNPKAARQAQAEHLFGDGSRVDVNGRTAEIFEEAGDKATATQIRINGPDAGASGTGGQGAFKDLISKDLQEAFRDPKAFKKILDDFDAKKLAKGDAPNIGIVDEAVPPKGKGGGNKKSLKDGDGGTPPKGGEGGPVADKGGSGNQPPKGGTGENLPPKNPEVDEAVKDLFADLNKRPIDKGNSDGGSFINKLDEGPLVKSADEAVDDVANKLREEAKEVAENARKIEKVQQKFAQAKGAKPAKVGVVSERKIKLSDASKDALKNPSKAEKFGAGETTTALKLDPKNPDSDVLKAFDKVSAEDSKRIVQDQINGAKDLKDADVNFLDIKGRGTAEVDTPITFGNKKSGDVPVKRTNDFLIQEQLPKDAVELKALVEARKAAGINPPLTRKEQIEILRQFHKTSKKGLLLTDTNLGNIAAKANGDSLFIESGSVIKAPNAGAAREAQAIRLFGPENVLVNRIQTGKVLKKAGNKDLANAIIDGTPKAGASGTGGQGAFRKLIDPDLQKKFANADEFEEILRKFDAKEAAEKAADAKKANQLVETAPRVTADEIKKLSRAEEDFKAAAREARELAANKGGKLSPGEVKKALKDAEFFEGRAKNIVARKAARIQQFDPVEFKKFVPGNVEGKKQIKLSKEQIERLRNPKPGDAFGVGNTTTAFKLNPGDANTSVIKAFDQIEGHLGLTRDGKAFNKLGLKTVDDQIAGARDLKEAGANFLGIEGVGVVNLKRPVTRTVNGKKVTKIEEVTHKFFVQQQLPKDAAGLDDLVFGGKATGLKFDEVLDEAQQIEILRQFHLTSKKGLVLRDPNFGNIAVKADGQAIFIESGSVLKIGKGGKVDPNLARRAQSEHLFGTLAKEKLAKEGKPVGIDSLVDRDEVNKITAKIFEEAGQQDVAKAILSNDSLSGVSGNGGQGQLGLVISKKLQKAFEDPVKFQKILDEFDAAKAKKAFEKTSEGKRQLANAKVFDDAAKRLRQKVDDVKKLELEANIRAGNQLDPSVLNKTPQFTPPQIKRIQELEKRSENALVKLVESSRDAKAAKKALEQAKAAGATGQDLKRLERANKRAAELLAESKSQQLAVADEAVALAPLLKPQIPTQVQADAIKKALERKRKFIANDNNLPNQGGQAVNQ